MCVQSLKFVALPIPEIIGGTQKFEQSLDNTPTFPFLHRPNFYSAFIRMDPVNGPNLKSVALPVPDTDCSFGVGLQTPILGKRRP